MPYCWPQPFSFMHILLSFHLLNILYIFYKVKWACFFSLVYVSQRYASFLLIIFSCFFGIHSFSTLNDNLLYMHVAHCSKNLANQCDEHLHFECSCVVLNSPQLNSLFKYTLVSQTAASHSHFLSIRNLLYLGVIVATLVWPGCCHWLLLFQIPSHRTNSR